MCISRGFTPPPQACPDGQQVRDWVSLDNVMLKHRAISHSTAIFGSDSPQSNTSWGNSIHPKWETNNVKHNIAVVCSPTMTMPVPMRELH